MEEEREIVQKYFGWKWGHETIRKVTKSSINSYAKKEEKPIPLLGGVSSGLPEDGVVFAIH